MNAWKSVDPSICRVYVFKCQRSCLVLIYRDMQTRNDMTEYASSIASRYSEYLKANTKLRQHISNI